MQKRTSPSVSPSLGDIARVAGVSVSTVSRALRKLPNVAPAVQARVENAAREVGYRPNPFITALMEKVKTAKPISYHATLGWIDITLNSRPSAKNRFLRMGHEGAVLRAEALGFGIDRIVVKPDASSRRNFIKMLKARGIRGLILPPALPAARHFLLDDEQLIHEFALVAMGWRPESMALDFCENDQFASGRLAHLQLLKAGYQRPGFIAAHWLEKNVEFRFSAGFQSIWHEHSDQELVPPLILGGNDYDAKLLEKWVRQNRIDSVVANWHEEIRPLIDGTTLAAAVKSAYAHLDADSGDAAWAGVIQPHASVGAAAVELLSRRVLRGEVGPPEVPMGVILEGTWQSSVGLERKPRQSGRP